MSIFEKKIESKEFLEFNRIMSLLLLSKVNLTQAIELYLKRNKNKLFKSILESVLRDLKSGTTLADSFAKHKNHFSEVYISTLRIAEETGNSANVFKEYTTYLQKIENLKNKVKQATRYPIFVLIVSVIVVIFLLVYLVPTFSSLFTSVGEDLPNLTKFIVRISEVFRDNIGFLSICIISGIIGFRMLNKKKKYQIMKDKALLSLPIVSPLMKQIYLARFSSSVHILLCNGLTLLETLKISRKTVNNSIFQSEIDLMIKSILKGKSLSTFKNSHQIFDSTFMKLILVGEESAELKMVFSLLSNYYDEEIDIKVSAVNSLLEPIFILVIGALVAIVLVSMYLPMFEIMNKMSL